MSAFFDKFLGRLVTRQVEDGTYDPAGTAAAAVTTHNSLTSAHGGMVVPAPFFRMMDAQTAAGNASPFRVAVNGTGTPFPRPLLFLPTSTTSQSRIVYASREQSQYLWKHTDGYWYISAAVGAATNAMKGSNGTSATIGTYTGQGTFNGTTMTTAVPTLAAVNTTGGEIPYRSIVTTAAAESLIVPSIVMVLPAYATAIRLMVGAGGSNITVNALFLVSHAVGGTVTLAAPHSDTLNFAVLAGAANSALTATIPAALRGKAACITAICYDSDMATPPVGGTVVVTASSATLEAV